MTLLQLQRRMAAAIMQPLTHSDRIAAKTKKGTPMGIEAAGFVKGNGGLSPIERLEIYSRSYWFRVLDSLYDDFPGLRALLGRRAFHRLSRAYLADCPSKSFTLRNLGSRLEAWMQHHPQYAGGKQPLALDMARLEWAHIETFDSPSEKVLGPQDLLELGPGFRTGLQPHIRLLALEYPVDDLRIAVHPPFEERGEESDMLPPQKHRTLMRRVSRLKAQPIFLAVHRSNLMVYYRRLGGEEYRLLIALRAGHSIGMSIQKAFDNSPIAINEQGLMLEQWFAAWATLGWLCPPPPGVKV